MTTVLHFPKRKADAERLALVGAALQAAIPLPKHDPELDLLLTIGAKLLDNLNELELDRWLGRINKWEAIQS
jgi:hypothetical protein